MADTRRARVSRWMRKALLFERDEYCDCGEVDCTRLAEDAAQQFDLYAHDADATIPEWVFDLAVDAAQEAA